MVRPDTLARLADALRATATVDGVCRGAGAEMRFRDLVSQYKNLWMRWTYVRQTGDVPLFYTTAAAIRRDAFLRVGGFDAGLRHPERRGHRLRPEARAARACRVRVHPTSRSST